MHASIDFYLLFSQKCRLQKSAGFHTACLLKAPAPAVSSLAAANTHTLQITDLLNLYLMHTVLFYILFKITVTEEPDTLYQKIEVKVKSHDKTVLDSYEFFATMAAKELGIDIGNV